MAMGHMASLKGQATKYMAMGQMASLKGQATKYMAMGHMALLNLSMKKQTKCSTPKKEFDILQIKCVPPPFRSSAVSAFRSSGNLFH